MQCKCGNEVEEERIELLNSTICSKCAHTAPEQESMKAYTVYHADGTEELIFMSAQAWAAFDKAVRARSNMHGGH